jgi:hypothetical protein
LDRGFKVWQTLEPFQYDQPEFDCDDCSMQNIGTFYGQTSNGKMHGRGSQLLVTDYSIVLREGYWENDK